jgi:hypothetical protein
VPPMEDSYEDIGLGGDEPPSPLVRSSTDGPCGTSFDIYTHGTSTRLRLDATPDAVVAAFAKLGYSPTDPDAWKTIRTTATEWRGRMMGAVNLTWRAPGTKTNKASPLARFRRRCGLVLYNLDLDLDHANGHVFLNVQTVRVDDIGRLLDLLGVTGDIVRLRRAERYLVLTPSDAQRLGRALG